MKTHLGLGTAAIGRPKYINIKQSPDKEAFSLATFKEQGFKMLAYAYNNGIRYFDTAPGYGLAENLLIEWLKKQTDTTIKVATKWGYTYVANFNPNAKTHELKEHSLQKLNEQWEVSKQLLPYLKNYQIHSATLDTGVLENKAVLERLFELKKNFNLKIGLTTTGDNQTEVLKKGMDIHLNGEPLFEVFQCTYNILDQSIYNLGTKILNTNKELVIKEVLANGRLLPNTNYKAYQQLYKKLNILAIKYNVGVDAIILKFAQQKLNGAIILSGANRTDHLEQNLKTDSFKLNNSDIEDLSIFNINTKAYWEERKALKWN